MRGKFDDFFTPEPVLFREWHDGLSFFDLDHLVLIALCLALAAAIVLRYLSLPAGDGSGPSPSRRRMLLAASGTALAILLSKDASYVVLGIMEPLFLPLHICNFCIYAAFVYALWPGTCVGRCAADILFCWGTTGCAAALFLPAWGPYCPAWSLASLCGFAEHALALGCALCLVLGGDYMPRPRRIWVVIAASVACGLAFRALNPILGTNFFFVTDPSSMSAPGTWLLQTFGDPGFLVAYLLAACCSWALVFGIWSLCARHAHKETNKELRIDHRSRCKRES
ncbi:MAG: YwaF family protein [Coriobacteriales bacterium]|nr:YwaF family protein [Coriobacteriales bacterium]